MIPPTDIAEAETALSGRMIRRCMDCKVFLGDKPCLPEMDGQTTDGICPECKVKRELPELCEIIRHGDKFSLNLKEALVLPYVPCKETREVLRGMIEKRRKEL
jgi:hypothetical protein